MNQVAEELTLERIGATSFVGEDEGTERIADLARTGVLVVRVELEPAMRGKLEDAVDDAIDTTLAARGAGHPGVGAYDREGAMNDRIFRARRLGFSGIAVAFGSLSPLCAGRSSLDADDCAALRALSDLTSTRPLWVLLKKIDRDLGAHAKPIALSSLFASPRRPSLSSSTVDHRPSTVDPRPSTSTFDPRPSTLDLRPSTSTIGACIATPEDVWRGWMLALTAARGPQSLAGFERLFVEAYLPLLNALASGLDDPRARAAMLVFRRAFEASYPEAAARFPLTDKRPRMVLDAPELAMKLARANGAKMSQIVLVESMRLDLGDHVRDALGLAFGERATLVDEMRLHAALPTTAARQLETIARGREALRTPSTQNEDLALAARGTHGLRKLRIGGREIFKLDTIEVALETDARCTTEHFMELADAVADAIVQHAMQLHAKTLLYVLGDRGFTLDANGRARSGGATPEEVIVKAYAFLLG
ncbi:MAG: hypothetical protein ACRELY_05845 [Polyangiaceae bacterium]